MSAATTQRNTVQMGALVIPELWTLPVKAATTIINGTIVCTDSTGYAVPATTALGLKVYGCAQPGTPPSGLAADNSAGSNGAVGVNVLSGVFPWYNSAAAEAIPFGYTGACFLVDNQTVALTDGEGTRSFAGMVQQVNTDGTVFVLMAPWLAAPASLNPKAVITLPVFAMTGIADGVIAKVTPGFAGRIIKAQWVQGVPVTTGSKLSTLTPAIAGVSTTGGAIALTSALCTPLGAEIDGSAITALNSFTAAQQISIVASSTTSFSEGAGSVILTLG